jgi:uncharacterized protein (TIGR02466 family)
MRREKKSCEEQWTGATQNSDARLMTSHVIGLFPTPVMRAERLLGDDLIADIIGELTAAGTVANAKSDRLSHTEIMSPRAKKSFVRASKLIHPKLVEFGALLFGESLDWSIKEIWVNQLETGGQQAVHTHANSFVSGVLYLTTPHPSANLVFHKSLGGTDFIFTNQNKNCRFGPYNGSKWMMPTLAAGDLVLFPSYLLHEVPINRGERRISVAFNAIPARLDSFGYVIGFF